MNAKVWLIGCAALLVAACDELPGSSTDPSGNYIKELPEGVMSVVARNQNLNAVRIDPTDGCYVYRYEGPVETTMLPLRTTEGRPICTRATAATTPPAAG